MQLHSATGQESLDAIDSVTESRAKRSLLIFDDVWGDIVHFHAVQLPHPEVTIEVDVEPKVAVASRKRILAESASKGWLLAVAHHPFPGIGHVRSEGKGYAWVPVEYSDLPTTKK